MNVETFFLYVATWSLVALTPGPAVLCSMVQSTRHGFRCSLVGISGIQLGNFIFFSCVALGLGALLTSATTAFTVLKFIGAIYLLYLGARIILSTVLRRPSVSLVQKSSVSQKSLFLQGLFIQITNPKALLFVSALLPQFIAPQQPALPQLVILVAATIVIDTVVLSLYAFAAGHGIKSYRDSAFATWLERAFGAALVFLGTRLLLARK